MLDAARTPAIRAVLPNVVLGACGRADADVVPATVAPATIGPENFAVVARGCVESGPLLSGTLAAVHEASVRAMLSAAVLATPRGRG